MTELYTEFEAFYKRNKIDKVIPDHILHNLSPNKALRPYQEKAVSFYLEYMNNPENMPIHLLFQMATGSGKTLMMAGLICDLYERGYRDFLFFVNSTNIIEKTRDNFLNPFSIKYLFNKEIIIGDKRIAIHEVSNFADSDHDCINIHFTTIQGLHSNLNTIKENAVTYSDFLDKKIVMISDEAHHINALTKKDLSVEEQKENTSWENTVKRIFESHECNILLEFTATLDTDNAQIKQKYQDKILFKYDLKEFRLDKYSKDIKLLQVDTDNLIERIFHAIILSQYRLKLASKHKVSNFKPVILLKSKTVKESIDIQQEFSDYIENLTGDRLKSFHNNAKDIIETAFAYLLNDYSYDDLARELKTDFSDKKTVSVNSKNAKDVSRENQILVNSLESYHNQIRMIFAVDQLNEGWDVLNLFDIVRLYDTRDAKNGIAGKTTNAEAQLIGRGARYYPFSIKDNDLIAEMPKEKRKFDNERDNPLQILEQLYYHCSHNPRYIDEIKNALKKTGALPDEEKTVLVKLKQDFKQTDFYKRGNVFFNKLIKNERSDIMSFKDYNIPEYFEHEIKGYHVSSYSAFEEENKTHSTNTETKRFYLKDFDKSLMRHAIDTQDFFKFKTIHKHFPKLDSVRLFVDLKEFLSRVTIDVKMPRDMILSIEQQFKIVQTVLKKIEAEIENKSFDYKGSKDFSYKPIQNIFKDKKVKIQIDDSGNSETGKAWNDALYGFALQNEKWFVFDSNYGSSEEKNLIKFIKERQRDIEEKYNEFYLIRNEQELKIYNYDDGKGVMPDFLLFLRNKQQNDFETIQVFLEPKGDGFIANDLWKQDFLQQIDASQKFGGNIVYIKGIGFYNEKQKHKFIQEFEEKFLKTA
jgi:type III restriction enzyme